MDKKYPFNKNKFNIPNRSTMGRVYAGPSKDRRMEEVYAGPPVDEPMAAVYAGPEYFNGINGGAGVQIPPVQMPEFCKKCGNPLKDEFRFCPYCGAPIPKEDK